MSNNGNSNSPSPTANNPSVSDSGSGSSSGSVARPTTGGSQTGGAQQTGGSNNNSSSSTNSSSISIPATAAAGGVQMIQPPKSSTSFYKIAPSEYITFQWNLTSLYVQPKTLTVRAFSPQRNLQWPVGPVPTGNATNMTLAGVFSGNTTQVVWNPYDWSNVPGIPEFAAETLKLRIYDERGETAPANKGGYLAPYLDGTQFAMYFPQSYTPWSDWSCPTCAAPLSLQSPATLPLLMSFFVIVISMLSLLRRDFA